MVSRHWLCHIHRCLKMFTKQHRQLCWSWSSMNTFKRQGFIKPQNMHWRETQVYRAPGKEEMHSCKGKNPQTCTHALKNAGEKGRKKLTQRAYPSACRVSEAVTLCVGRFIHSLGKEPIPPARPAFPDPQQVGTCKHCGLHLHLLWKQADNSA